MPDRQARSVLSRALIATLAALAVTIAVAACGSSGAASKAGGATAAATRAADRQTQTLSATASIPPMTATVLYQPIATYRRYVNGLLAQLRPQLATLHAAAMAGARTAAERDWLRAHVTWLRIGQDDSAYGAFGELGRRIDGLAAGLIGGVDSPHFTGFHRVELELWRRDDLTAAAAATAELQRLVRRLTPRRVAADLPATVISLNAWVLRCHEILEDALRDTLSGDDDYGSHSALVTLSADVSATGEMLGLLATAIDDRIPKIVPEGAADLRAIDAAIDAAGGPHAGQPLTSLATRKRQLLDAVTDAALETLAPVSELMQIPASGS